MLPDSDVVFPEKHTCFTMVYAVHVPWGFLRLNDTKRDDIKLSKNKQQQHCRAAVGTSTRAVACAFSSPPQPLLCAHPSMLSDGHKNLLTDSGDDLLALLAILLPLRQRLVALGPFMPSTPVSRSPCRRFVSIVAVSVATSVSLTATSGAWSDLRSSSSAFSLL